MFEVLGPSSMHVWSSLGHRVRAPAARSGGAAGVREPTRAGKGPGQGIRRRRGPVEGGS